jgi:hypothetical protein
MPQKTTERILSIASLVMILRILYAHVTPVRERIYNYLGKELSKIQHDVGYHLACMRDPSHGNGQWDKPKKKSIREVDSRMDMKRTNREKYKQLLTFYAKRMFPNLPTWTKPPDTPHTKYIKKLCLLIKQIKYAHNRSGSHISTDTASKLANYYLDNPKLLCTRITQCLCNDAPFCDYIRYCGMCKQMYCYHNPDFNMCTMCTRTDIECSLTWCYSLIKCPMCTIVYCSRDSNHRSNGCPGSSDDSDSSDDSYSSD